MVETSIPTQVETEQQVATRTPLTESILDNLSMWTVVAAAIGFLYLVWATVEILSHYVGAIPSVAP